MALLRKQGPAGSAVLGWDDSAAMTTWQAITAHHLQVCESFDLAAPDLAPIRPTAPPWLAVSLTPTFTAANTRDFQILALAILAGVAHAVLVQRRNGNNRIIPEDASRITLLG
jgi:hypothetical protein